MNLIKTVRAVVVSRWAELVILVLALVITAIEYLSPIHHMFFVERDPRISFPKVKSTVPIWAVGILLVLCGLATLGAAWVHAKHEGRSHDEALTKSLVAGIAIVQSVVFGQVVTHFLKAYNGRPRPNFFALCNYKGYRDYLENGDLTGYLAQTIAGQPGDLKHCLASAKEIREAQLSFPSGHASTSFSCCVFLALFIYFLLPNRESRQYSVLSRGGSTVSQIIKFVICLGPVALAAFIAASRAHDNWHAFDDVLAGSVIGAVAAWSSFWYHYEREKSRKPTTPSMHPARTPFLSGESSVTAI